MEPPRSFAHNLITTYFLLQSQTHKVLILRLYAITFHYVRVKLLSNEIEKGKPVGKRGRKAMGPPERDRQVAGPGI